MFQILNKIVKFLWKRKKTLTLIFLLTILMFSFRFPWNNLLKKSIREFQKQSSSSFQFNFDELDIYYLPPGFKLKKLSLNYKRKNIHLDSLSIFPVLKKWLAFKQAYRLQGKKEESGFYFVFWKKEKKLDKEIETKTSSVYFLKGESNNLQLQLLNSLFSSLKMSGNVNFRLDFEGSLKDLEKSKASFVIRGSNVKLSQMELKTPLGPLNLPSIKWTDGEILLRVKDGTLFFETFRLGTSSDNLFVQMRGSAKLLYSYGKLRLDSYDFQMQIDMKKQFQLNLLDLMFSGYKKDEGTFFRYLIQITGEGEQVPNIEKLVEF